MNKARKSIDDVAKLRFAGSKVHTCPPEPNCLPPPPKKWQQQDTSKVDGRSNSSTSQNNNV